MGVLTREAILAAAASRAQPLEVEEWGGTVYVRPLPASVTQKLVGLTDEAPDWREHLDVAELLRYSVCDEDGELMFDSPNEVADFLDAVRLQPVSEVVTAIFEVSAMTEDASEALVKN